ncbi:hypothetical protein EW026_g3977 [Hermanssonia centrifuga]|uniref:Uncharacterized protein n=1 Tax=Hermanssonia centrifuga TaxID=98765 RepID=A0A4S4KIZ2_9APHY|nr:hypothetical protein EW026_g3977 [Hermanssonia centrifuga]
MKFSLFTALALFTSIWYVAAAPVANPVEEPEGAPSGGDIFIACHD